MKVKLFSFLLALAASVGTMCASVIIDGIAYNLDDTNQTAEVISSRYTGDIIIPASVNYNSVTYNVTSIRGYAFSGCYSLTSVTIPNSVTNIGEYTFSSCYSLTSISVATDNPNYCSVGGVLFTKDRTELLLYPRCKSGTSYSIDRTVTSIGNGAFSWCTGLTSITIPNTVTSIGNSAFSLCRALTSIEIPNSVTNLGRKAFSDCGGLTSVTIGNSITGIKDSTFSWCSNLTTVTIGNGVTSIGEGAFSFCSRLTYVTIPSSVTTIRDGAFYGGERGHANVMKIYFVGSVNEWCNKNWHPDVLSGAYDLYIDGTIVTNLIIPNGVTSIGSYAFRFCNNLASVTIPGSVASIGWGAFSDCSNLTDIYVACEDTERIKQLLRNDSRVTNPPVPYTITAYADHGSVTTNIDEVTMCDFVTCSVNSDYGYHFDHWSDGNTDNPRMVLLTQDTTFTAEFAFDKSGTCGENNALTWSYDDQSNTLTINGNGALTENYTFGVEATKVMNTLVIGDGVTAIGDSAFYGIRTLIHLFIGANVATIGDYAFAECRNIDDITCYSILVPTINATTFANIGNKQYIYLYVPVNRERSYKRDEFWGEFDIQIKEAETTTTDGDVVVVPTDNTAEISWPTVADADTYEIEITKDGVVVCVLKFNTNGQLVGIAFAPGRNGANYTQQAQTAGFKFTVTGLTSGTRYGYTIAAKDALEQTVDAKSGTFTTTIEGVTTDIDQVIVPNSDQITNDPLQTTTKLLRNGQILILRGDRTYTLTGAEMK